MALTLQNWNDNEDTKYLYDIQITILKKSQNFHYSKHNLTFKNSTMKMNFHSEFKVEKLHTTKGCTCTLSTLVLSVKRHDVRHRCHIELKFKNSFGNYL